MREGLTYTFLCSRHLWIDSVFSNFFFIQHFLCEYRGRNNVFWLDQGRVQERPMRRAPWKRGHWGCTSLNGEAVPRREGAPARHRARGLKGRPLQLGQGAHAERCVGTWAGCWVGGTWQSPACYTETDYKCTKRCPLCVCVCVCVHVHTGNVIRYIFWRKLKMEGKFGDMGGWQWECRQNNQETESFKQEMTKP